MPLNPARMGIFFPCLLERAPMPHYRSQNEHRSRRRKLLVRPNADRRRSSGCCVYMAPGIVEEHRPAALADRQMTRAQVHFTVESEALAGRSAPCAHAATRRCAFAAADVADLVPFEFLRSGPGGHTQTLTAH